jgi:phenylalanyl-tRNA synthetase beta chain
MNVSLNWLKQYIDINSTPDEVSELLTDLGLEVEGMEHTGNDLPGVVVGHVLECERVPDTKLSLTKVNVGGETPLQIICGAPNVAAGQKVVVALVGTTLTFKDGKTLTLTERPVRGMVSQGMICAEDELGIGDDHSGIIVLAENTVVGTPAKEVFGLEKDIVFEVGLTPNRSDAMGHLGIARDLAARLKVQHGGGDVRLPDVSAFDNLSQSLISNLPITVKVEDTEGCPRYSGVCISGVKISESPNWLKNRLASIGVNSINNVVDITNFVLHEFGQPLHAFDYDKIGGASIVVKTLPTGTPFKYVHCGCHWQSY